MTRQLTHDGRWKRNPRWSPDGRLLAVLAGPVSHPLSPRPPVLETVRPDGSGAVGVWTGKAAATGVVW